MEIFVDKYIIGCGLWWNNFFCDSLSNYINFVGAR